MAADKQLHGKESFGSCGGDAVLFGNVPSIPVGGCSFVRVFLSVFNQRVRPSIECIHIGLLKQLLLLFPLQNCNKLCVTALSYGCCTSFYLVSVSEANQSQNHCQCQPPNLVRVENHVRNIILRLNLSGCWFLKIGAS
uniref:Uncharacterized protein n=1 Tax=Arundo donax TaxID=35708 RepID=A0A0A9AVB1_ARUDO